MFRSEVPHRGDNLPCHSSTNNRNIIEETDDKIVFPSGAVIPGKDNVITIVQVCTASSCDSIVDDLCVG